MEKDAEIVERWKAHNPWSGSVSILKHAVTEFQGEHYMYHETWDDAKAQFVALAGQDVEDCQIKLDEARALLDKICALKPPEEK
jgi:hypothetical protein